MVRASNWKYLAFRLDRARGYLGDRVPPAHYASSIITHCRHSLLYKCYTCNKKGRSDVFAGVSFIAASAAMFPIVRPRGRVVKPLAAKLLLGDVVAIAITITGGVGAVVTLLGLGRSQAS